MWAPFVIHAISRHFLLMCQTPETKQNKTMTDEGQTDFCLYSLRSANDNKPGNIYRIETRISRKVYVVHVVCVVHVVFFWFMWFV